MRVDPSQLEGLIGFDSFGDTITALAYRGDAKAELEVVSHSISWDASRLVQGQATLVASDDAGELRPRRIDDLLAPGGSRLRLGYRWGATGFAVGIGTWRIRNAKPTTRLLWRDGYAVPWEGTVAITADEDTASASLDRLDTNERVSTKASVLDEVKWLLRDQPLGVVIRQGVTDSELVSCQYQNDDRLGTVASLITRIGAAYRMTPSGDLEVVPATGVPTDWAIRPGEGGSLVIIASEMSDDSLANAVTSSVTLPDELVLEARATLNEGPLAFGGPFGRVRAFHNSVATTIDGVVSDCTTYLGTVSSRGDVPETIECLSNPAIQLHDLIRIEIPYITGTQSYFGRVSQMTLGVTNGVPSPSMQLTVMVPNYDL